MQKTFQMEQVIDIATSSTKHNRKPKSGAENATQHTADIETLQ